MHPFQQMCISYCCIHFYWMAASISIQNLEQPDQKKSKNLANCLFFYLLFYVIVLSYDCVLVCYWSGVLFVCADPPSVAVNPLEQVVNQTDRVTITCTIFAIPFPQVTWTDNRNGLVVTGESASMDVNQMDSGNIRTSELVFLNIVKADESNYTCTAVNNVTNIIGVPEEATGSIVVQGKSQQAVECVNVMETASIVYGSWCQVL